MVLPYTVKRKGPFWPQKWGQNFDPRTAPIKWGQFGPFKKGAKFGPTFRAILAPHSRADLAPLVAKLALLMKSAPSQWGQFSPSVGPPYWLTSCEIQHLAAGPI